VREQGFISFFSIVLQSGEPTRIILLRFSIIFSVQISIHIHISYIYTDTFVYFMLVKIVYALAFLSEMRVLIILFDHRVPGKKKKKIGGHLVVSSLLLKGTVHVVLHLLFVELVRRRSRMLPNEHDRSYLELICNEASLPIYVFKRGLRNLLILFSI